MPLNDTALSALDRVRLLRRAGFQPRWRHVAPVMAALLLLGLAGCNSQPRRSDAPAPAAFTGPQFLRGTVGSMATVQGYAPMFISGYGIVVDLPNTGSSEVPRAGGLRDRLMNEMRQRGYGQTKYKTRHLPPSRVLASHQTAVVAVEGMIPAGATKGSLFDVVVTALPATQTTSLQGGLLFTTAMSVHGTDLGVGFSRSLAEAHGPVYINPFAFEGERGEQLENQRRGVILSGGVVTADRPLQLVLNQASWDRSQLIADRINERFPAGARDRSPTAVAKDDVFIELHVPETYAERVEELLGLIQHLYVQRSEDFQNQQAQRLGEILVEEPNLAPRIIQAWHALGRTTLPIVRDYYDHTDEAVRLAALEAGVRLGDHTTVEALSVLAEDENAAVRMKVALLLHRLPDDFRADGVLQTLIDDPQRGVRITAYEALVARDSNLVLHHVIGSEDGLKFFLDFVPSSKPLIYISQRRFPRIVVFGPDTGFQLPMVAGIWDNQLMFKGSDPDQPVEVFYQTRGKVQTFKIAPTVGNLLLLLGQPAQFTDKPAGLNLSYSQAISALFALHRKGHITAPIEFEDSPLAAAIAMERENGMPLQRPDIGTQLKLEPIAPEEPIQSVSARTEPEPEQPGERPDVGPILP